MFNADEFSNILKKITSHYESITEFAEKSDVNRTYLSKYINKKMSTPPSPKVLMKIAKNSFNLISYEELMNICGYIKGDDYYSHIMGVLGFSDDDLDDLGQSYSSLNLSEKEQKIFSELLYDYIKNKKERKNKEYLKEKLKNYDLPTQEKIISSFCFFLSYLGKIYKYTSDAPKREINKINKLVSVPIIGKISAGQPILAEENIEGYLPLDPNIYGLEATDDLFFLRVSGQSMNLKIRNGDYALIHKQDYAEDGDIVVAIVNGEDEATLKKYKRLNEQFVLLEPMSTDSSIEAITIDLKNTTFKIIGKAIGQFGKF